MNELEIILPIHPSVPSIWELAGLFLAIGLVPLAMLVGFWFWKSEPISDEEVQRVFRKR